jgi:CheY-like chemotaxis protein
LGESDEKSFRPADVAEPIGVLVVLVALSGLGQQEDKAQAAHAGFDRHFTKPVDVNSLRAFLAATGDALAA